LRETVVRPGYCSSGLGIDITGMDASMDQDLHEKVVAALQAASAHLDADDWNANELKVEIEGVLAELSNPDVLAAYVTLEMAARSDTARQCVDAAQRARTKAGSVALFAAALLLYPAIVADLNDRSDWPVGRRWDEILDDAREVALGEGLIRRVRHYRGTDWSDENPVELAVTALLSFDGVRREFIDRMKDGELAKRADELRGRLLEIMHGDDLSP
jgi:hypothetical protein